MAARWTSSLHPRAKDGKFSGGAGGGDRRAPVGLVGKGRNLRYNRMPTRGEVTKTVATRTVGGALIGGSVAGVPGAAVGGALVGTNVAAQVFVLSRRTKKHAATR